MNETVSATTTRIEVTHYGIDFLRIFELMFGGSSGSADGFIQFFSTLWAIYSTLALIVSGFLIFGIMYAYIRYNQFSAINTKQLLDEERLWQELYNKNPKHSRWQAVQAHVSSGNPNDWKLAIIEADIMLGQALHQKGYGGSSIGEQLKSISPHQMRTLQDAWEAHKVRNQIAHEGADYILTHKVAKETIVQYQRVFSELGLL